MCVIYFDLTENNTKPLNNVSLLPVLEIYNIYFPPQQKVLNISLHYIASCSVVFINLCCNAKSFIFDKFYRQTWFIFHLLPSHPAESKTSLRVHFSFSLKAIGRIYFKIMTPFKVNVSLSFRTSKQILNALNAF